MVAYIYSMHITTAYQSSLIVFLSDVPREKAFQNTQDLVDSTLTVEFHENHRNLLEERSSSPIIASFNKSDRIMFTHYLNVPKAAEGETAFLAPRLSFSTIIQEDVFYDKYNSPRIIILPEPLTTVRLNFFISKGHPLQPLLDWYTLLLIEAGLPDHYAKELTKKPRSYVRRLQPFGVQNVAGAFVLFLVMTVFSFLIWLGELLLSYTKYS